MTTKIQEQAFPLSVAVELGLARHVHAPINSAHEGWAVLVEEMTELRDEVFKKREQRDSLHMLKELIQVGAMAQRMAEDLGLVQDSAGGQATLKGLREENARLTEYLQEAREQIQTALDAMSLAGSICGDLYAAALEFVPRLREGSAKHFLIREITHPILGQLELTVRRSEGLSPARHLHILTVLLAVEKLLIDEGQACQILGMDLESFRQSEAHTEQIIRQGIGRILRKAPTPHEYNGLAGT